MKKIKIEKRHVAVLVVFFGTLILSSAFQYIQLTKASPSTPNPGHSASEIGAGAFTEEGDYIFPGASKVGIGTATPGAALEVAGQVKITGGSPGSGKLLASDASGLASWQTPAAPPVLEYVGITPPAWKSPVGMQGWQSWDLTSYVPVGAKYADIQVRVTNKDGGVGYRMACGFNTSSYEQYMVAMVSELNDSRIVQIYGYYGTLPQYRVIGYWK